MKQKVLHEANRLSDKIGTHQIGDYKVVVQKDRLMVYVERDWVAKIDLRTQQTVIAHDPVLILDVLRSLP